MKKNKILIPALAVLAFSTVASVTSTVAWFTSSTAVTVTSSRFQVSGINADMTYSCEALVGVEVKKDSANKDYVTAKNNGTTSAPDYSTLTHGSFNIADSKVYSKSQESTDTSYIERGTVGTSTDDKFLEESGTHKYNCFAWKITFNYESKKTMNLYFNHSTSSIGFDNTHTLVKDTANAGRAFRLAFINGTRKVVWSPYTATVYSTKPTASDKTVNSTDDKTSKYVSSTTGTSAYTTTTTGNLIYMGEDTLSSGAFKPVAPDTAGSDTRKDCLGQLTSTTKSVTVTVVAWFEGDDDLNILNGTTMPEVSTDLKFYLRSDDGK